MGIENPVPGEVARTLLGEPGPPMSRTRYGALLRVTGNTGKRFVLVSVLKKYLKEHLDFSASEVYPKRNVSERVMCVCGREVSVLRGRTHHHLTPDGLKCEGVTIESRGCSPQSPALAAECKSGELLSMHDS